MSTWETAVANEFDLWSTNGRASGMESGHSHGAEAILSSWTLNTSSKVLDIGCGQGWLLRRMLQYGAGAGVGVDVSAEMIRYAKEHSYAEEAYLVASAHDLPFEADQFSHIISIESIYYHTNPESSLLEWRRVAKPDALLGVMVDLYLENTGSHAWVDALNIPVHLLSIPDYISMLEATGWRDITIQQVLDPRPITPESEFKTSSYYPTYSAYLNFRNAGSLVLKAQA